MTMYFSPSTRGFFDTAFHGERQIEVVNEAAYDRAVHTAGAMDLAAFDEAHAAWIKGGQEGDEPLPSAFRANLMWIDDAPPMMWIENPACTVPTDAVEITPERHAELLAAQAGGQVIAAGATGHPEAVVREVDFDAELKAMLARRDAALKASDWTQLPDAPLTAAARKRWSAYRTRLRAFGTNLRESTMRMKRPSDLMLPVSPAEEGPVDTPS